MACCDGCAKTGGSCGDKKILPDGWSVGSVGKSIARVGQFPTPEAEDAWRQGVTLGWVGGAGTVLLVGGALWLMRGR